jgi:hypothetical protein
MCTALFYVVRLGRPFLLVVKKLRGDVYVAVFGKRTKLQLLKIHAER